MATPFHAFFAGLTAEQARPFFEYLDGERHAASEMLEEIATIHETALIESGFLSRPGAHDGVSPVKGSKRG